MTTSGFDQGIRKKVRNCEQENQKLIKIFKP